MKALYRAGRVLSHLGELGDAVARLQKALSLSPQDKTIQTELTRALKKQEHTLKKEKEMYRRMMEPSSELKRSTPPKETWVKMRSPSFTHEIHFPCFIGTVAIHVYCWDCRCCCHGNCIFLHSKTLNCYYLSKFSYITFATEQQQLETCA